MKKSLFVLAMSMVGLLTACSGAAEPAETTAAATEAATTGAAAEETGAEAEATEATTGGTLTMATNAEFPPYEYHEGGEIVGIDVEIAKAIAEHMGMTLEIEDIAFDSIIPSVDSGKADFGAAGMTVTEDRLQNVDFSTPYTTATQMIIVQEGSDIVDVAGLDNKKIGVQLGTTGDIYVEDVEGATIERFNKGFEAVQALSQGKLDAVVIDGEPAKVFVSQNEGLVLLDEPFTTEEYAICVKKGNEELLNGINEAIADLSESGKLDEIKAKYITAE